MNATIKPMPVVTPPPQGLLRAWLQALAAVVRDKGVLLLLIGAPVLYGFFYPWFYADEVLTRVQVAVVDMDRTSLSRQIARFADADPRIDVRLLTGNEREAQEALWRGEIEGYVLIPAHLKRSVVRGESAVVSIEANGAYALLNKAVQYGFAEAVGAVSAGVEIRQLQASGQSAQQARASRAPVQLQMVALFNPTEGYGSFVVPAVALLILQQTLLMGAAMLTGTWVESGQHRAHATTWLGRLLALSTLGWASGLFYFGWIFLLHDYPVAATRWAHWRCWPATSRPSRRWGRCWACGLATANARCRCCCGPHCPSPSWPGSRGRQRRCPSRCSGCAGCCPARPGCRRRCGSISWGRRCLRPCPTCVRWWRWVRCARPPCWSRPALRAQPCPNLPRTDQSAITTHWGWAAAWGPVRRRTGPLRSSIAFCTSLRRPTKNPSSATTNSGPTMRPIRSSTNAGLRPS